MGKKGEYGQKNWQTHQTEEREKKAREGNYHKIIKTAAAIPL